MLKVILSLELLLFCIASVVLMPTIKRYWRALDQNNRFLGLAWSAMIVGQHQFLTHDSYVEGVDSINAAASYQLIWMFVAGVISLPIILSTRFPARAWSLPVVALAAYVFFAFGSAVMSVSPAMTVYRAMQLLVDLGLLLAAYALLLRAKKPEFLVDVSIFWLVILLFSVIAGALIVPDLAFVANKGALGEILRSVAPRIHPNELGLMAAIGLVVGIVRGLGGAAKGWHRFFWFSLALIAGTILFLAQARTSLASSLIALFAVGFMVKRLRWLVYAIMAVSLMVGAYYVLSGVKLGIEDTVEAYARRGVSDEHIKNLSGRTGLWQVGWEMFKDSPVIGHGFQTGVRNKGVEYGLPLGVNMHSSHMQVLVDTGALGYIAWLIFVFGMSARTYKNYKCADKSDDATRMVAVEHLLIVFVILFRSVLGHVLVSHQLNLMIFLSVFLYSALRLNGMWHNKDDNGGARERKNADAGLGLNGKRILAGRTRRV